MRAAALIGLLAALGAACEPPHAACDRDRISVIVRDATGLAPATYQVVLTGDEASPVTVTCPGDPACTATGVRLVAQPRKARVVVKARAHRTAILERALDYRHAAEQDGACGRDVHEAVVVADLEALPPLEWNDDYATGVAPGADATALDALAVTVPDGSGETRVVKFLIDATADPQVVYFQNTRKHLLHYAFARQVLGVAMSQDAFSAVTYQGEDRQFMAGSLIRYADRAVASASADTTLTGPVTIEFFPSDDLTPAQARGAYRLIEERLGSLPWTGTEGRLAYAPATSIHETALAGATRGFASNGALWLTRAELHGDVQAQYLNPGKGCGTLHRLSPEQLASTPLSFRDLVVLTRLPNEVPLVGGTITEELQTPLAHVNVAARARGTPNLALLGAGADPRVAPYLDRLVCLEVTAGSFALYPVTLAEAQAFWDTLIPPDPLIPEADLDATGLLPFAEIGFADSPAVGVKAANLAELHHLVPDVAPDGFAVPFAWYHAFMTTTRVATPLCDEAEQDCTFEGRSAEVCQAADALCLAAAAEGLTFDGYVERLLADPLFTTDTVVREATLDGLQTLLQEAPTDPAFAALLEAEVNARWGSGIKVRLRSSTNSEDLPSFSGAGLYSSYSCQLGTTNRPSVRIRKVWASTWSFAAFEERAYWNIDHRAVKMAVAVHPSYPDEDCNGVLITQSIANPAVSGHYVNLQLGEASVTNPESGILPEVVTLLPAGSGVLVLRDRYSSLSPDAPLMSDAELDELFDHAMIIQEHFSVLYGENPATFALDMELKRIPPGRALVIKQVRPYPR